MEFVIEIADGARAFWQEIVAAWQTGFLGQPFGRGLLALGVLALGVVFRRLIAHVLVGAMKRLAGRTSNKFDDELVEALEQPIILVPIAGAIFIASQLLGFDQEIGSFSQRLIQSILIFLIFWALYRLVRPAIGLMTALERMFGATFVDWTSRVTKLALALIGAASVLDVWGVPVLPFLASLSLLSVAVALGTQDLFKNLIAGMLIIGERRFAKGDWIRVDGVVEGTVEQVGFRSTLVRRFDKAPVQVPNANLADNPVVNFTRMSYRRIYWVIGVEYRASVAQLAKIRNEIEEYILSTDEFAKPPAVTTFVRIDKFNDSSIDILLYAFTKTTNWVQWLTVKEMLAYKVKEIVEGAGVGFAFPSQSVYVEALPGPPPAGGPEAGRPDLFEPPNGGPRVIPGAGA